MIHSIEKILQQSSQFKTASQLLKQKQVVNLAGLNGSGLSFFVSRIGNDYPGNVIIVTPNQGSAEKIWNDLLQMKTMSRLIHYFPSQNIDKHHVHPVKSEVVGLRLKTLDHLVQNQAGIIITTIAALNEPVPTYSSIQQKRLQLETGLEIELERLAKTLTDFGYERTDMVSGVGEFCVRGGLVDVFPFESMLPVRVEFFGDVIDSIRTFEVIHQRSKEKIDQINLLAPSTQTVNQTNQQPILDYFSPETIFILEEPEQFEAELQNQYAKRHQKYNTDDEWEDYDEELHLRSQQIAQKLQSFRRFEHHHLGRLQQADCNFNMTTHEDFRGNIRLLRQKIKQFIEKNRDKNVRIFILLEEKYEVERLLELLDEKGEHSAVQVSKGILHSGFTYPSEKLMVITEKDIYGRIPRKRNLGKFRGGIPVARLNALSYGDLMVHIDHGIGRYVGLAKILVAGSERECLKLEYRDNDILYVNIEHLRRVNKYKVAEGIVPQLNKLGGKDWDRLKQRTRKVIEKMTRDILNLYAIRKAKKGYAFSNDTPWQKELEISFLYDETVDQLTTITDVKKDMESDTPMDRLVCGDVGFGKTEVAVRAAFKAVMDGKQVAVLVPTTVLAQQHYTTFSERLSNYPMVVELLSRFRKKASQQKIVQKLKEGQVDIVIGTHRLLSPDVKFRDLGLLIVDEEHRFGVKQKEKIKSHFKLVDVLSLTATPIPRTLYFALMGSRDMSTIETPPKDRLPVIAEVLPFDQKLIRQAILDEVRRGGQVFFVHNRVRSIDSVARMVNKLIPDIRVAIAHGQMKSHQLEQVMTDFVQKKYDCLVSTMIIESGLDMPNVNTLIVNRADKFGLAQLYQLKGRVGRSNRQAYAYFMVPAFKFLSSTSLKRLQTIEEHLELGAGLQIAMKDLEIRGAGNLLGAEQSGYINAVGFDLYSKLLQEAVAKIKGGSQEEESKPQVDVMVEVEFDAYIPDNYVDMDYERINIYQRLTMASTEQDILELEEELRDRFGPLPKPVRILCEINRLRILCGSLGIEKLKIKKGDLTAYFSDRYYTDANKELLQKIIRSIQESSTELLRFLQGKKFGFKFRLNQADETSLHYTRELFNKVLAKAA